MKYENFLLRYGMSQADSVQATLKIFRLNTLASQSVEQLFGHETNDQIFAISCKFFDGSRSSI